MHKFGLAIRFLFTHSTLPTVDFRPRAPADEKLARLLETESTNMVRSGQEIDETSLRRSTGKSLSVVWSDLSSQHRTFNPLSWIVFSFSSTSFVVFQPPVCQESGICASKQNSFQLCRKTEKRAEKEVRKKQRKLWKSLPAILEIALAKQSKVKKIYVANRLPARSLD